MPNLTLPNRIAPTEAVAKSETARVHYADYTAAREAMLKATHTKHAPWTLVDFNDQRRGRLTLIRDVLDRLPDTHCEQAALDWPPLNREPLSEAYGVLNPSGCLTTIRSEWNPPEVGST